MTVHGAAWRILEGEVPAGMHLHHRCGNKLCWNPAHLTLLSASEHRREHGRLITHCPHGHEYTPENTVLENGSRACRECKRIRHRERMRARAGNCIECGASLGSPTAKRCRDCHTAYMRSFSHRAG
jgi:ribosomal protein L40E